MTLPFWRPNISRGSGRDSRDAFLAVAMIAGAADAKKHSGIKSTGGIR